MERATDRRGEGSVETPLMYEGVGSWIWLTGAVLAASTIYAFARSRDPLHPLIYISPMLAYVYFVTPAILVHQGLLEKCFPQGADVGYAQAVILAGVTAFCLGALNFGVGAGLSLGSRFRLSEQLRRGMRRLSFLIGGFGLVVYFWLLQRHGGLAPVYGRPKGGFYGVSGYLASAPLLTIPATLLYLLSHYGRRRGWRQVLVCTILMSPHLLHALLGARRGTAFLAFGSLFFGWYVTRPRRPSLGLSVASLVAVGFLLFFLGSQRTPIETYMPKPDTEYGPDAEFLPEEYRRKEAPPDAGVQASTNPPAEGDTEG